MAKKEKKIDELEKKIRELEKKIEKAEEKPKKASLVGGLLGSFLPGLGGLVEKLGETSPEFREKLQKAEKEMDFRIRTGWSEKRPRIRYGFNIKPLFTERHEIEEGRIFPRKKEKLKVVVEVPKNVKKEDLTVYTRGKKLIVETKDKKHRDDVDLPFYVKREIDWEYEKGILLVKLEEM